MTVDERLGYPVVVAEDVRSSVTEMLRRLGRPYVTLCDANPHVAALARDLSRGSRCAAVVRLQLGERAKSPRTLARVWEQLARCGAGRDAVVLGVGGGVAADVLGFAAATYLRGVSYLHVATSLVAMADAAIGGKTGVNLRAGKNLAGAFAQPIAVYAHLRALRTLPLRALREGLAEVVKAAIIEGDAFFRALERLASQPFSGWPWERVVSQAIGVKTRIVAQDFTERGPREVLNLGHTFGHALERASEYRITHGAGVALGLRAAGLLALRLGAFSEGEQARLEAMLARLKMPTRTSLSPASVLRAMQVDKKRRGGRLRFVLPRAIGDVEYGIEAPERDVLRVLRELHGASLDVAQC